ncbi:cytochrome P450 [Catenaria anguillulae PL171]|uniref:Cytochrome P450 n=1 Tax=Catenaria anguillulae PL171 TaxID=765915 RepID=A0A1Y2H630_9FUNG|nr:cytochrome P450 [Catenaria anguillulae PL171]
MDRLAQVQAHIASTLLASSNSLASLSSKLTDLLTSPHLSHNASAIYSSFSSLAADKPLLTTLAVLGLVTTYMLIRSNHKRSQLNLPPSPPGAWPLLGHLPLLARHAASPPALFTHLASQLGPVFLLRLGAQRMLVINSDTLARESLLRNGKAYAGRLLTAPWSLLTEGGGDMAFAPYGDTWRGMRRAAHRILTPAAVDAMDHRLEVEADRFVDHLTREGKVHVAGLFQRYTANVIFAKALGITFERLDDPGLTKMLDCVLHMFRVLAVGDGIDEYVPDSGWFWGSRVVRRIVMWTAKRKMDAVKRVHDEFHDGLLMVRLNELKAKLETESREDRLARELFYAEELLLQANEGDGITGEQIKLMMADLLLAGMDTTAGTLIWLTILLVNHLDIQRKAYNSLLAHCGADPATGRLQRTPTLADVADLNYIRAIVKETLRLIPIGPLGLPRATVEDTQIAGYHVPKGTQVVYNIEAIHESMYPAREGGKEFRPERWLQDGKCTVDVPDGIYTFGLGRRQCPGMHLANRELCLVTARMVAAFELRSGEVGKKQLSMEKQFGLTTLPKHGALVEFVPRT